MRHEAKKKKKKKKKKKWNVLHLPSNIINIKNKGWHGLYMYFMFIVPFQVNFLLNQKN